MPRLSKIGAAALAAFGWTGLSTVTASYLVVAGGGGGGSGQSSVAGSGGGAGGLLTGTTSLNTTLSYSVTVGAGGTGGVDITSNSNTSGSNSVFNTVTSIGGGAGGTTGALSGQAGGSGGGGTYSGSGAVGGTGTAGPPRQGYDGGVGNTSSVSFGGGGGGAGAAGTNGSNAVGGTGGAGLANPITGSTTGQLISSTYYLAGGGGGGLEGTGTQGAGGAGGGGTGNNGAGTNAVSGTANTGGGGGGAGKGTGGAAVNGGKGGAGVVIISYIGVQKFGGGVVTSVGGNTIHTFTTSGTLVPLSSLTANYLIVAGGGGAGTQSAGGGGAGGLLSGSGITIDKNSTYLITVGSGGAGAPAGASGDRPAGANGTNSAFSMVSTTAIGGGGSGSYRPSTGQVGASGGSGGGGGIGPSTGGAGGTGTSGQGFAGGTGGSDTGNTNDVAGGGGGAGGAGVSYNDANTAIRGNGGIGVLSSISGTSTYYAGGGGGATHNGSRFGTGGAGGGGDGGNTNLNGTNGTDNTGGGGGGGSEYNNTGGNGGSGVVIISYPGSVQQMSGGEVTIVSGNVIHTFKNSGYLAPFKLVNNSLRFRRAVSGHLTRTNATTGTGGTRTWTLSVWVKRGYSGVASNLLSPYYGGDGTNEAQLYFTSSDTLQLYDSGGSAGYFNYITTQVFRDPAAWYHIVAAYDSTQAIASNRLKVYVNGSQVTSFSTATIPNQNALSGYGGTSLTAIGAYARNTGTNNFDGYMSEYNFIDGQQLTPNSFGTFNSYGVWQPIVYGGSYGINGFYLPFNQGSSTFAGSFNGSSQWLTWPANLTFGTNNWTVELWVYFTGFPNAAGGNGATLFRQDPAAGRTVDIFVEANKLKFYSTTIAIDAYLGTETFTTGQWYHVAVVKNGNIVTGYVNGTALNSPRTGNGASIGNMAVVSTGKGDNYTQGYVSNLRVVNGTAVYTSAFVPTTSPLTNISNTNSLILQSATVIDNSSNAWTITNNGAVTMATYSTVFANPKSLCVDNSPAQNNWTPNNISNNNSTTYDSMTDVPTLTSTTAANYAVLNSLISQYNTSTDFTNEGNLKFNVGANGGVTGTITATIAMSSGKWYAEVYISAAVTAQWVGVSSNIATAGLGPLGGGIRSPGYAYKVNTGNKCNNDNTGTAYAAASTTGDTIGIAMDADTGSITFYKNGISLGVAYTGMTNAGGGWMFGGDSDPGGSFIWNFGQRPFRDTPPATYLALNTYNL